jgi:hypothetical protein
MRMRFLLTALAATVLLTGCGTAGGTTATEPTSSSPSSSSSPAPEGTSEPSDRPEPGLPEVVPWDGEGWAPPLTLDLDGTRVPLKPWTACYATGCYDGMPPEELHDVGTREEVPFSFPDSGWSFEATFRAVGPGCSRAITVPVQKTGDRTFAVHPAGPAGTWDVDVFGRGEGDVITTFRWTTSARGEMPEPDGYLGVVADHDGRPDSYGVELSLNDLATHPREAVAVVTVTAANGESLTLEPMRPEGTCYHEGHVFFRGSEAQGDRAAALGPAPFRYDVGLTLDGVQHAATAVWPRDQIKGLAPYASLTFDPPLPAYRG